MSKATTVSQVKERAESLLKHLKSFYPTAKLGQAYELIAREAGFTSWPAYKKTLSDQPCEWYEREYEPLVNEILGNAFAYMMATFNLSASPDLDASTPYEQLLEEGLGITPFRSDGGGLALLTYTTPSLDCYKCLATDIDKVPEQMRETEGVEVVVADKNGFIDNLVSDAVSAASSSIPENVLEMIHGRFGGDETPLSVLFRTLDPQTRERLSVRLGITGAEEAEKAYDGMFAINSLLSRHLLLMDAVIENVLVTKFSRQEISLICDSCNGLFFFDGSKGVGLPANGHVSEIYANVHDSIKLDALDEKWNVDAKVLLEKLGSLDVVQYLALRDFVGTFWNNANSDASEDMLSNFSQLNS